MRDLLKMQIKCEKILNSVSIGSIMRFLLRFLYRVIKRFCAPGHYSTNSVYSNNPHTNDELKTAITEYIQNVDHAMLNTVFENTIRRVNKCLETGWGHLLTYSMEQSPS